MVKCHCSFIRFQTHLRGHQSAIMAPMGVMKLLVKCITKVMLLISIKPNINGQCLSRVESEPIFYILLEKAFVRDAHVWNSGFDRKTLLIYNHVNRESKSLELTIYLYRCYEHEAPSSSNTTIYLSWLIHSEDVLGGKVHRWGKFHTWWVHSCEHKNLLSSQC